MPEPLAPEPLVPEPATPEPLVTVVGVGADGWAGLPGPSREALLTAGVVVGSERQLALLGGAVGAERVPWPTPLLPALQGILQSHRGSGLVVLASGDPMFFGIGASIVRRLGPAAVRVLPHPSAVSLACARLGWPVQDVDVVSLVGRPLETIHPAVQPGRRLLVLVSDADGAAEISSLLRERGYGPSAVTVLEQLGGPAERVVRGTAATAATAHAPHDPLAVLAIECVAEPATVPLPRSPGLPDDEFDSDGQLTKREVRAVSIAALAPVPGQLLWDVGAGSGSVGIEWMRTHPACRAVAIEPRADRRERIARNARTLGVPALTIVDGAAPAALRGLPAPDAIFVGGGVSGAGVLDACVAALRPGGRLVANAVTVQAEGVLAAWHARLGGTLVRIAIQRAAPVGSFTGWRPALPVTQWSYLR
ncbi:MAG: precorrin-6y C5,15-methyltransferase (decarboxylating), CbiE subunit [Pseudonocardiales bacterium]|nr:precorrin-6y C5,15-methyltransferase (decarboxylating), CbiE subunit [Pseudonocardiales bacterium]